MSYVLAIDYGSSFTTAAVRANGQSELLSLSDSDEQQFRTPSLVWIDEEGNIVVGWAAERGAALAPERLERSPKQFLGEEPLQLGRPVPAEEAAGATLRLVVTAAMRRYNGEAPKEVLLTHPASWSNTRKSALRQAARAAGLEQVRLVDEPVAAARYLGTEVATGDTVAVYDLGGGTFDCAVLRRLGNAGFDTLAVGGQERLGGETFDARLLRHLGEVLAESDPEDWDRLRSSSRARASLRREARTAKEALSIATTHDVVLPEVCSRASLRLTREELERVVEADVRRSIDILRETVSAAGLEPEGLKAVFVAGGASRMPMVGRLLAESFGRVPSTRDDPKAVVVLGAVAEGPSTAAVAEGPSTAAVAEGPSTPAVAEGSTAAAVAEGSSAAAGAEGSSAAGTSGQTAVGAESNATQASERRRPFGGLTARTAERKTHTPSSVRHLRWAAPVAVVLIGAVVVGVASSGGGDDPADKVASIVSGLSSKWTCESEAIADVAATRRCSSPDLGGEVVLKAYAREDDLEKAYDARAEGEECSSKYPEGDAMGSLGFEVRCTEGRRQPRILLRDSEEQLLIEIDDRESVFGNLPLDEAREFASLL